MWVSIHNTGLAVQGSSSRCLSRLPRVLPGLEEAVRASWVYSQKVLVIYGFLTRFSSLYAATRATVLTSIALPTMCT